MLELWLNSLVWALLPYDAPPEAGLRACAPLNNLTMIVWTRCKQASLPAWMRWFEVSMT